MSLIRLEINMLFSISSLCTSMKHFGSRNYHMVNNKNKQINKSDKVIESNFSSPRSFAYTFLGLMRCS